MLTARPRKDIFSTVVGWKEHQVMFTHLEQVTDLSAHASASSVNDRSLSHKTFSRADVVGLAFVYVLTLDSEASQDLKLPFRQSILRVDR